MDEKRVLSPNIRMKQASIDRIKDYAKVEGRSYSDMVRVLLWEGLKAHGDAKPYKPGQETF